MIYKIPLIALTLLIVSGSLSLAQELSDDNRRIYAGPDMTSYEQNIKKMEAKIEEQEAEIEEQKKTVETEILETEARRRSYVEANQKKIEELNKKIDAIKKKEERERYNAAVAANPEKLETKKDVYGFKKDIEALIMGQGLPDRSGPESRYGLEPPSKDAGEKAVNNIKPSNTMRDQRFGSRQPRQIDPIIRPKVDEIPNWKSGATRPKEPLSASDQTDQFKDR